MTSVKQLGVLFLLLLPVNLYAQPQVSANQPERVCWQENRKLTWRDFRATANQLADFGATAHIVPQLGIVGYVDAADKSNFHVSVSLNPQRCWVADSVGPMAALVLAHEQLHFDICELVARKLRRRIAQVYQAGQDVFNPEFGQEVDRFMAEFDEWEERYDQQTDHGRLSVKQRQWDERVQHELTQLNRYKSVEATCYFD